MSSQLLVGFLLVIKEKGCNSRVGCAGLGKAGLPVAGGGICRDLRIAKQASSGSAVCGNTRSMRCRCLVFKCVSSSHFLVQIIYHIFHM